MSDILESLVKIVNNEFDSEYNTLQYKEVLSDEDHFYNVALDLFKKFNRDGSGSMNRN